MFKEVPIARCMRLAFSGGVTGLALVSIPALAQDVQRGERVEVTGSALRRVDAETSVPVTVIKIDDLKKEGVTTVEQVLARISSNQSLQGTTQSVGLGTGGASFANLRGLGQNKTLVLLNGRRLANNAIDNTAPDLNVIPFAALERVEVLRDGASALYGTDAVGGVINFITRKDFQGGVVTLGLDRPIHDGGHASNANIGYGFGDLNTDRFNIFGVFDYEKQDPIRASQRAFVNRIIKTSPSFPGNYNQGGNVENPAAPGCDSPNGTFLGTPGPGNDHTCGYLYARKVDLVPNTERFSGLLRGTIQLNQDNQFSLEYFGTQDRNNTLIAGVPYGALRINPGTQFFPGNGITPLPTAFTLNPTYKAGGGSLPGAVKLRWRDIVSGGRAEQTVNTQERLVAALTGTFLTWDYTVGAVYNENRLNDRLTGGYTDGTIITPGILNGIINPFGPQTAAGAALITSAAAKGELFSAKGRVSSVDAKASRDLGDWLHTGNQAAIAVGTDFRYENFREVGNPPFDQLVISSTGFDPTTDNKGARHVLAGYAELNVPILKSLDVTAAVRYDKYSDFGHTTNPKVSFRFQPVQQILFRGSYSSGFRAPSLYELNGPTVYNNSADNLNDPLRCPGGVPIAGVSKSDNCAVQFLALQGGNKALKPETARNATLGLVLEPTKYLNLSFDLWSIRLKGQVGTLQDTTIFADPVKYASLFHRAPDGSLSTDGSLCPGPDCGYFTQTLDNLGNIDTNGIDLGANYRLLAGNIGQFDLGAQATYVHKYKYQREKGGEYIQNIGIFSDAGPVFKWQYTLNANWSRGPFGIGVTNRWKSGYTDQNNDPTMLNHVGSYSIWDFYGSWQATKQLSLTVGVRNAFDKDPPFSNQTVTFQTGYDPRFTDPTGRTFYARGTLTF